MGRRSEGRRGKGGEEIKSFQRRGEAREMAQGENGGQSGGDGVGGSGGAGPSGQFTNPNIPEAVRLLVESLGPNSGNTEEYQKKLAEILGKVQDSANQAAREELKRQQEEKKKRKEEKRKAKEMGEELTPKAREKRARKVYREEERKRREEEKKEEEHRKTLPVCEITEGGNIGPKSYVIFKNALGQVMRQTCRLSQPWLLKTDKERENIKRNMRMYFRNGATIPDGLLRRRISTSLRDKRNHEREKIRSHLASHEGMKLDFVGDWPRPTLIDESCWNDWRLQELQMRAYLQRERMQSKLKSPNLSEENVTNAKKWLERWEKDLEDYGLPPKELIAAKERAKARLADPKKKLSHLGQGGSHRLEADFVSFLTFLTFLSFLFFLLTYLFSPKITLVQIFSHCPFYL